MFLAYIAGTYVTRNKLEKAISEFLHSNERMLIEEKGIVDFQKSIITQIDKLNKAYSKCKPINASFYYPELEDRYKDIVLHIGSGTICNFRIYQCKPINKKLK